VASRDARVTVGTISKILLWIVYVWVVINLMLLFLAFWLRLFGANPQADFTQWVYRSVSRSMAPFRGIFEPIVLSDQSVLDTSLLFAMIVYGLAALFLRAGIDWASDLVARRRRRLEQEVWDDRLEAMPTVDSTRGGPPPSPVGSPFDRPPPR
jgi:Na+-translocating ferredoxin:NAD+ oxidoreductase RnfA subunit